MEINTKYDKMAILKHQKYWRTVYLFLENNIHV